MVGVGKARTQMAFQKVRSTPLSAAGFAWKEGLRRAANRLHRQVIEESRCGNPLSRIPRRGT